MFRLLLISLLAALAAVAARAADADSLRSHFEFNLRGAYAFSSNPKLTSLLPPDAAPTHSAASLHLKYSLSGLGDALTRDVRQGLGLSLTTFLRPHTVGTPAGFYLFQNAPVKTFSDRFYIAYEWNFGLTLGWHRTRSLDYLASNIVSGSRANSYINLSIPLAYRLDPHFTLFLAPEITHYSNGNTSWPNPGINTLGLNLGLVYTPAAQRRAPRSPFAPLPDVTFVRPRRPVFATTLFCAWRKSYYPVDAGSFTPEGERALLPGRFGVIGLSFNPLWQPCSTFRYGPALDIQWSENTGLDPYVVPGTTGADTRFTRPPFLRQTSVGLSARAELLMPVFAVNIGLGYGLIGPHETRNFYQMANLKIYLTGPSSLTHPLSPPRTSSTTALTSSNTSVPTPTDAQSASQRPHNARSASPIARRLYLNIGYRFIRFSHPSNLMVGLGYEF